jgi:hypothetical protein
MAWWRRVAGCSIAIGLACLCFAWLAIVTSISRWFGDVQGSCGSVGDPTVNARGDPICQRLLDQRRHTAVGAFHLGLALLAVGLALAALLLLQRWRRTRPQAHEMDTAEV